MRVLVRDWSLDSQGLTSTEDSPKIFDYKLIKAVAYSSTFDPEVKQNFLKQPPRPESSAERLTEICQEESRLLFYLNVYIFTLHQYPLENKE